jgi:hypothetical protein
LQRSLNQLPKPAAVYGLPYSAVKNVRWEFGVALRMPSSSGWIGIFSSVPVFCWRTSIS